MSNEYGKAMNCFTKNAMNINPIEKTTIHLEFKL